MTEEILTNKVNKFLKCIESGYSKQRAFQLSGLTISEWPKIYTEEFVLKVKELEKKYNMSVDSKQKENASIIFNPELDNYMTIDFNNIDDVEKQIEKTIHYMTLKSPSNTFFAKNSISMMTLRQRRREVEKEWKNEQSELSKTYNINTFLTFDKFIEKASYPPMYPKQKEMVDFANSEGIKIFLAARKYGKTDYITILNSAYQITTIPNVTIMIITKEEARAKSICRAIRQTAFDNGVDFEVKSAMELRVKGHFGKEASVLCLPLGSTGFRGHHVDKIILDDPVIPADKNSPASRERAIDVYNELVNLSKDILVIGQPVHRTDLYAVLREAAMNSDKIKLLEYPHGTIPELDTDLVLLRNQGVSEESIGANYLLKLRNDGILPFIDCAVIPNDKIFNPMNEEYAKYHTILWIDPAKMESGRDYTAIALIKITPNKIYIIGFAWKQPYYKLLSEINVINEIYEPKKIFFEINGLSDDSIIRLDEWGIKAIPYNTHENKEKKISAMTYIADDIVLSKYTETQQIIYKEKEIHLTAPNKDFTKLFTEYEYGSIDDPVDAVASYLLEKGVINVTIGKDYKL